MNLTRVPRLASRAVTAAGESAQPIILLLIRLYWGWSFFQTGRGKLMNLTRTADYFASLAIPFPTFNALIAGTVECVGGALLLAGFCSRLVSLPLMFTMAVAYATAEREALMAILSNPDGFTAAAPFLFFLTAVLVFAFGPGRISLDAWLDRRTRTANSAPVCAEREVQAVSRG